MTDKERHDETAPVEMTFWDHLDELRKSLTYPVIVLLLLTVVAFSLKEPLFDMVLAANSRNFITYQIMPGGSGEGTSETLVQLINTELPAQLLIHMKVSFYVALVLTIPYLFFKLFRFATPALYENERKYSGRILTFSFLSFFAGLLVNYFVIFPFSLRFLVSYQVSEQVPNFISITSYINMLMTLSILMGVCFELPVVSWILSLFGVLKASMLRQYRRHAFVGILILAAIITPTTDIFTLLLVSLPIVLLYELSILISWSTEKGRKKRMDLEESSV